MTTKLSANGGSLLVPPTRRFGPEAVSYEIRGLTYPGILRENDIEQAHLVNNRWVHELPSLTNLTSKTKPAMVSFGDHGVVEKTYVPVLDNLPVLNFIRRIRDYVPKNSYVRDPIEYFTKGIIRAKEIQPSKQLEFIAHPLVARAMLMDSGHLSLFNYIPLPVNRALADYFPNLVTLFTQVTDPEQCRTILGDALVLVNKADSCHRKGLFYPVLDFIHQSIK